MELSPGLAHQYLRAAFRAACAQHDIRAELGLDGDKLTLAFAGQENAEPGAMTDAFVRELEAAGMSWEELRALAFLDEARLEARAFVLRTALARLRVLLVEHNSWLSGGLAWALGPAPERLRERGLAIYRFPARAAVDVVAERDHVRIAFQAGDLGSVTSSGFYVPTRVRGDFCATLEYRLAAWEPGPEAASYALFAQDEPSRLRYYAQRRSAGSGGHEVFANFSNQQFSEPRPVSALAGAFRLKRCVGTVIASHRENAAWTELGRHAGDPPSDMILGSKIWSSGRSGVLEAHALALAIEGELPDDQIPPVPLRPDPRGK